jgi:site-specific recombinase XerD
MPNMSHWPGSSAATGASRGDAYALRQFVAFCDRRNLKLFEVRRNDIEAFGRELEAHGRATATIARRLCTVTGFYRYAEEAGLIAHSLPGGLGGPARCLGPRAERGGPLEHGLHGRRIATVACR